ncbi:MAG: PEP-CTERM sorting domain-containing protein [Lentisphaeria bacterium]
MEIRRIIYVGEGESFSIDDLSFTVPEPASLGLLGLGALVLSRRRQG